MNTSSLPAAHSQYKSITYNKDCIVFYVLLETSSASPYNTLTGHKARMVYNKKCVTNISHISFKKPQKRLDKSLTMGYTVYVDSVR